MRYRLPYCLLAIVGVVGSLSGCGPDGTNGASGTDVTQETASEVAEDVAGDAAPAPVFIATLSVSRQLVGVESTEPLVLTATVILGDDVATTTTILGEVLYGGAAIARFTRLNEPVDGFETERSRAFEASINPSSLLLPELQTASGEATTAELVAQFVAGTGDVISRNVTVNIVCGPDDLQQPDYWFCAGSCGGSGCGGCGRKCEITPRPYAYTTNGSPRCPGFDEVEYYCGAVILHDEYATNAPPRAETCDSICARYQGTSGKPGQCTERCYHPEEGRIQFADRSGDRVGGMGIEYASQGNSSALIGGCGDRPNDVWNAFNTNNRYVMYNVACCCEFPY